MNKENISPIKKIATIKHDSVDQASPRYIKYDLRCTECNTIRKKNDMEILGFCWYCKDTCWEEIKKNILLV